MKKISILLLFVALSINLFGCGKADNAEEMQSNPKYGYQVYTSEIIDKIDTVYGKVPIVKTHTIVSEEYGGYDDVSYLAFVPLDYDYILSVCYYAYTQPGDLGTFKTQLPEMLGLPQ